MNDYEDMLIEALDLVASEDLPEEMLPDLVFARARLMAGISPDHCWPDPYAF